MSDRLTVDTNYYFFCRSQGPDIRDGALHIPVGKTGDSLLAGKPPTSGGFDYGVGANFKHSGGGNTWVGGSTQNGGTLGVGGSYKGKGGGSIKWGAGYSPKNTGFRAQISISF